GRTVGQTKRRQSRDAAQRTSSRRGAGFLDIAARQDVDWSRRDRDDGVDLRRRRQGSEVLAQLPQERVGFGELRTAPPVERLCQLGTAGLQFFLLPRQSGTAGGPLARLVRPVPALDAGEDGLKGVVVLLRDRVELVVMTAGT